MNSIQKVALYMRLSKEDLDKGNAESESIQNQRMILDEYASSHGWEIYDHYIDEDFSGSDRSRPDFNRMIEDAKNGKFNIVLVKTQSRFARDIKVVEDYIHNLFKEKKIRFVSALEGIDTMRSDSELSSHIHAVLMKKRKEVSFSVQCRRLATKRIRTTKITLSLMRTLHR